jgi:hypothetical protein
MPGLRLVHVVQLSLVGRVRHPLVQREHTLVAGHHHDRPKLQAFRQVHGHGGYPIGGRKGIDSGACTADEFGSADENAYLLRLDPLSQPI